MKRWFACFFLYLAILAAFFVPMILSCQSLQDQIQSSNQRNWTTVIAIPTGKSTINNDNTTNEEVSYQFKGQTHSQYVTTHVISNSSIELYMNRNTGQLQNQGWSLPDNSNSLIVNLTMGFGIGVVLVGIIGVLVLYDNWEKIFRSRPKKIKTAAVPQFSKTDIELFQAHKADAIKALAYEQAKRELEGL